MSFLKRIFGRDFEATVEQAEALARDGRFGEAVLSFREALERTKNVPEERVRAVRQHLDSARDELARAHVAEGRQLAAEGYLERALEAYETAVEVAASGAVVDEARALLNRVEADDARAAFEQSEELSDEERFEVLAGDWGEEQAAELVALGEPFRRSYLAMWEGEPEAAADQIAGIAASAPDAVFLHLVLGHAQLLAGRHVEAVGSAERFLAALEDVYGPPRTEDSDDEEDEREEDLELERELSAARVKAHDIMAAAFRARGDLEQAEQQLRTLVELLPEQAGPYVVLGRFLRDSGRNEDSLAVLEEGRPFMGEMNPDMRVPAELGLTHRALGNVADAIEAFKAVIDHRVGMDNYDFPVEVAVPLAELYEKDGRLKEASDIYRHLAAGSHKAGHFDYNLQAARLLVELGESQVARRHAVRARELATDDEEGRAALAPLLEKLGEAGPRT